MNFDNEYFDDPKEQKEHKSEDDKLLQAEEADDIDDTHKINRHDQIEF